MILWAFLLSLAYYPGYLGFIAWFALVRPLWIISHKEGREAFNAAYFYSFFFTLFSLYWVFPVTFPGTLAAIVIVAFYYTTILVAFSKLYRFKPIVGFVALPFLWVGMEYFRTLFQIAFPWSELGYTQAYYLYVLQIVSIIGVHGLSFLIVIGNVLIWQALRRELSPERRVTSVFALLAMALALVAYGWVETPKYATPGTYPVALLQGSVPLDIKWELENEGHSALLYDSLARTVTEPVKLFVWPESAVPCYLSSDNRCYTWVSHTAAETHSYQLVGALGSAPVGREVRYFNSCFQFNPQGQLEAHYDKTKLVPFSEQVPYQNYFPFMRPAVIFKHFEFIQNLGVEWWSDFYPGDSLHLFDLPDATYGTLICFESAFPDVARQMVLQGAQFLVGITNDTWFGKSVGIYMHSRIFITRAVENHIWAARAANSGLTYVVDPYGRIRENLPVYAVAALTGKLDLLSDYTFFTKHGDIVGQTSFVLTVAVLAILLTTWLYLRFQHSRRSSRQS